MTTIIVLIILVLLAIGWRLVWRAGQTDWGYVWLNWLDGLNRLFCRWYHRLPPLQIELPQQGGAVVVANHVSGLDPLLLVAASRRPLRFLIARDQYQRFGLTWLFKSVRCIPVDRVRQPERALREALQVLAAGEVIALFPHGGFHLDYEPPRRLKPGVALLAQNCHCPIVPVRITGVGLPGAVLRALWVPSRIQLQVMPWIMPQTQSREQLLHQVQAALEGKTRLDD